MLVYYTLVLKAFTRTVVVIIDLKNRFFNCLPLFYCMYVCVLKRLYGLIKQTFESTPSGAPRNRRQ